MLRRLIFWDYARGSWQYDLIVAVILAFIFLMPREWFRDQPRLPHPSSMFLLPQGQDGRSGLWIEPHLLTGVPVEQRVRRVEALLRGRTTQPVTVLRVQEVFDDFEEELKGYIAVTQPDPGNRR